MKSIYIIYNETTNRFKLGFSKNPTLRVKSLQTGNDNIIKLYYERKVTHYSKVEAFLKRHFKQYRTSGEWYEYPLKFAELDTMIQKTDEMFESLIDNPFV